MNDTVKSDSTGSPSPQERMNRLETPTEDVSDDFFRTESEKYCYSSVAPHLSFFCLPTDGAVMENATKLPLSPRQTACLRGEDCGSDEESFQGGAISFDFEDEVNGKGESGGGQASGGEENHEEVPTKEKHPSSAPPVETLPPFAMPTSRSPTPPGTNTNPQLEIDGALRQHENKSKMQYLRGANTILQPFPSSSPSQDHSPPPYETVLPPPPSVTEKVSQVDVYEALQFEPFFATRLDFRSFHSLKRGNGMHSRGSSSSTLLSDPSVGIFIGQLCVSYTSDDIIAVLHTLSSQVGQQIQIRSIKPRGGGHTCAFVMINSSALPVLLGFNKRAVCDLNSLWLVDDSKIPYLRSFLEEKASRHIMRSGVPRAAVVMEKLEEQARPSNHANRKTKKPVVSHNTSSSSFPLARTNPAFSSSSFTTVSSLDDANRRVGNHRLPPHQSDVSGNPSTGSFCYLSHSVPGSSSFSSTASCSSSTVPTLSYPSCRIANPPLGWQPLGVVVAPSLIARAPGREGAGPFSFFGGEPLIAGTPWSPMGNTTFFYSTPSTGSPLLSTPGVSSNVIMMTMPPPPPPPPSPPPPSAPSTFSQNR